jgi:hypothetical protein
LACHGVSLRLKNGTKIEEEIFFSQEIPQKQKNESFGESVL